MKFSAFYVLAGFLAATGVAYAPANGMFGLCFVGAVGCVIIGAAFEAINR